MATKAFAPRSRSWQWASRACRRALVPLLDARTVFYKTYLKLDNAVKPLVRVDPICRRSGRSGAAFRDGGVQLRWHRTNMGTHGRFVARSKRLLRRIGLPAVLSRPFGIDTPSHQCGSVRMGSDPPHVALDPWCRADDHPNLFVVDASFFPNVGSAQPR